MKKLIFIMLILIFVGCTSTADKITTRNAARCDRFVELMEEGNTTREQEQDFIKANRKGWHSLNYYLNDHPLPEDLRENNE